MEIGRIKLRLCLVESRCEGSLCSIGNSFVLIIERSYELGSWRKNANHGYCRNQKSIPTDGTILPLWNQIWETNDVDGGLQLPIQRSGRTGKVNTPTLKSKYKEEKWNEIESERHYLSLEPYLSLYRGGNNELDICYKWNTQSCRMLL